MLIKITSDAPSAVSIHGEGFFRAGTDKTLFRFDAEEVFGVGTDELSTSALIVLTPVTGCGAEPLCRELSFYRSGTGLLLKANDGDSCGGGGLRLIDWSADGAERGAERGAEECEFERVYELICEYPRSERAIEPKQLDSLEFELSSSENAGSSASVLLYRDCGLRLSVRVNGGERGYILGRGTEGELRLLDAGFARLIVVHASFGEGSAEAGRFERLLLFNERFELEGELEGDRCFIEDGRFIVINELGTVFSHQQRLRYEPSGEGLRSVCGVSGPHSEGGEGALDEAFEIGYFTHPMRLAADEWETALALMECLLLGRGDEAMALLTPALAEGLDFGGLSEFFGDFDEARASPFRQKSDPPIIGAVKEGRASAYGFELEGGLISDISELASPFSQRAQEGAKEAEE
ncbi:MAG: hypothetical protein IKI64_04715 [Clostridia bacterium]|nr:hypothetical protein [Clostridia bacterium]